MRIQLQLGWIGFLGLILFVGGGCCAFFSAPRSASEFGSKRLLNSYSRLDVNLQIIEYNEDLSINKTHNIQRSTNFRWADVKACDQYYVTLAPSFDWGGTVSLSFLYLPDDSASHLSQFEITVSVDEQTPLAIAVAPSGRSFVFLSGPNLGVYNVARQQEDLNVTQIAMLSISDYLHSFRGLTMSDSKIRFIFNETRVYTYNYKTNATSVRDLSSSTQYVANIDTYNDYWLYTSQRDAILEDPLGNVQVFNYSTPDRLFNAGPGFILPSRLSATKDFIDIAVYYLSTSVLLGTLNPNTNHFEPYNTIPSKSLGLLTNGNEDPNEAPVFYFHVGHRVIMYQVPPSGTVALSVPSLPGNHSCSMGGSTRLSTFWCSGYGRYGPTNPCPSGTYQPSSGYTTCLLCPEGTYQPQEGSISCLSCKADEYCPLGSTHPEIVSMNSSSHDSWDFPISETVISFEEILLMLLFASSITSTSISVVLLGCIIITAVLLISLLIKRFCGVSLHQWLAKIDIHKKTKYETTVTPSGSFKTEAVKVESVFGGYLTLLAAYILLVGLITTIVYVNDYHPLLVGHDDNNSTSPSQNSVRTASLQDYNTQSKASQLANIIKGNLHLNISIVAYNFQTMDGDMVDSVAITNCNDQYGNTCDFSFGTANFFDKKTASFELQTHGSIRFTEAKVSITLGAQASFTFATVEISTATGAQGNFQTSKAKYLVLPGDNKVLEGLLLIPVTMTVVVRETELDSDEFNHAAYMSFVSDESKLHNMGHSNETYALTNNPITLEFLLQLDNNWRLESEQRRFSGTGAFFAALLAIIGLYEVTLLASELAHRVFHSIEKRHKKRSKYEALEDPPLIVNEKSE